MPTRIASPPRTLLLTAVAALALAVSGCGQEDDPAALLQTAFNTQVDSATVTVNARANLRGPSPQAAQPYGLRLSGPYKRNAENQLPSIDFQVAASLRCPMATTSSATNTASSTWEKMRRERKESTAPSRVRRAGRRPYSGRAG